MTGPGREDGPRLHLVRHGEAEWQRQPTGDLDSPLTPLGMQQSHRLGAWLAEGIGLGHGWAGEVGQLWTSPLQRSTATARVVAGCLGLEPVVEPNLREATFRLADHVAVGDAPLAPRPRIAPSAPYEAFLAQARRAAAALVEAGQQGGPVLCVSHRGLIDTVLQELLGAHGVRFELFNTGITTVEWRAGRWRVVQVNQCEHLPPDQRTGVKP